MATEEKSGQKSKVNDEAIEKKMVSFNNSQDSVQALSLWIMHHKAHHRKIVDVWLRVLKKSQPKHKLTLMYLCNDVVQHAKRKKALYYLDCYKTILKEAVSVVSECDSIKANVDRILNIWGERNIYNKTFVLELKGILDSGLVEPGGSSSKASSANNTPTPTPTATPPYRPSKPKEVKEVKEISDKDKDELNSKIVAEFKPPKFIEHVIVQKRMESDTELKRKQLSTQRIDATSIDAVKQLKDKAHGKEFCKQFEDSCVKVEEYVSLLEKMIEGKNKVLEMATESEIFYEEQFKEARIVANAYKNFGARISNMKKKVDELKKSLPDTPSPVPSPSADAPSPGNTPPLEQMDDNETVDMEMSDEEGESSKIVECGPLLPRRQAYTATVKSIPQPIPSVTGIRLRAGVEAVSSYTAPPTFRSSSKESLSSKKSSNVLESRIATMLPALARGNSSIGGPEHIASSEAPILNYTPPKPVRVVDLSSAAAVDMSGDRASTPVMDEQDEKSPRHSGSVNHTTTTTTSTTASSSSKDTPVTKANPIDFLSQLLTKKSSSSSSNFLQGLSLLTDTVKTQVQQQKQTVTQELPVGVPPPVPDLGAQSTGWATWKAVNQPPPPPPPPTPLVAAEPISPQGQPLLPPQMHLHMPPPPTVPPPQSTSPIPTPASQPYMPHIPPPSPAGIQPPSPNQPVSMASPPVLPKTGYNPTPVMLQFPRSEPPPMPPHSQGGYNPQMPPAPLGSALQWDRAPHIEPDSPESMNNPPPSSLPPPPPKGILRNRKSSLKEVTLVDESQVDKSVGGDMIPKPPSTPPTVEKKPQGILKKPQTPSGNDQQLVDVQSEFIAKLKRKTANSNLVVPPISEQHGVNSSVNSFTANKNNSNLTSILPSGDQSSSGEQPSGSGGQTISVLGQSTNQMGGSGSNTKQGEPISTIGVVSGATKRSAEVYGGDMDIDDDSWGQEDSGWDDESKDDYSASDPYYNNKNDDYNDYYRYREPRPQPYSRTGYYDNQYRGPPPKQPYLNMRRPYYRY